MKQFPVHISERPLNRQQKYCLMNKSKKIWDFLCTSSSSFLRTSHTGTKTSFYFVNRRRGVKVLINSQMLSSMNLRGWLRTSKTQEDPQVHFVLPQQSQSLWTCSCISADVNAQLDIQELPETSEGQQIGDTACQSHAVVGVDRLQLHSSLPFCICTTDLGIPSSRKEHQVSRQILDTSG